MNHAGSARPRVRVPGLARCHAFEPAGFAGFDYLLGQPRAAQRSRLGDDPAEAHTLMRALAQALPPAAGYWPEPLEGANDPDDNPSIPSGYTYLLQLVAHDMVQTSIPFWAAAALELASRNLRSSTLLLDTLYGGGPTAATVAYRPAGYSAADRTDLRVGSFKSTTTGLAAAPNQCPFRDLARINLDVVDNVDTANFEAPFVTCAADTRNDDNLVLAQLVALFATLHNALTRRLASARRPEAIFGYAQVAMQRIYHAIIVQDLLPRLLHPEMPAVSARLAGEPRWLWRSQGMPLEFTHGAFRIGHAMVRTAYRFNNEAAGSLTIFQSLNVGQSRAEMRYPLQETWIIDWSQFFGPAPDMNLSRRLSPTQSALDTHSLFRSSDPSTPENLALRDMLSAALSRSWRVDALLEQILAQNDNPIPPGWAWRDDGRRREAIREWLSTRCTPGFLSQAHIGTLVDDPPLPLFVLLEAALDPAISGRHLGPLGSLIVSEVIGRSIARERQRLAQMENAARTAFGTVFWDEITAIASMPALIEFARRQGCLP